MEERPTAALAPQVVGTCRKLGAPQVFYIAADMASPEAPQHVVQFALDKLGEGRGWLEGAGPVGGGRRAQGAETHGPGLVGWGRSLQHAGWAPP